MTRPVTVVPDDHMLQEYDVVRLRLTLADGNVPLGSTGTILIVYDHPVRAYEVEFMDNFGRSLGTFTTDDDHLEKWQR